MEATSAGLAENRQAAPAAHSVDLVKTYGTGEAAVDALAGVDVTFERAGSPP